MLEGAPSKVRFEIPFAVDEVSGDLALYLGARGSIQEIRLNDEVVKPNVPLDSFSGACVVVSRRTWRVRAAPCPSLACFSTRLRTRSWSPP